MYNVSFGPAVKDSGRISGKLRHCSTVIGRLLCRLQHIQT
jgi:hypothetical protein